MGDLSVAVIVGRLTRDGELKMTSSGMAVCHFSVATNSRVKKDNQWIDEPNYWEVDIWGKRAESLSPYLKKGTLVALQGDMRQDKWEQDGQMRSKIKITANDVQLLGGRSGEGQGTYSGSSSTGTRPAGTVSSGTSSRQTPPAPSNDDFTDDIPF